jgi:uncharacterized membrane protein YdjX (TVP38/TMEM64 family)
MQAPDDTLTTAKGPGGPGSLARFAPLLALAAVAAAAWFGGLPHMLSPAALAHEQAQLHALATAAPIASLAAYVLAYAVITGACLPLALMLSLAGGLIFGPWIGAVAVLAGATGGAVLTYVATRSAFAPALLARAGRDPRLGKVMAGFGRNAFSYVLTLRLAPFVPFALVNVAAGLAAVPVRAFALGTLAGGAPAAIVYSSLGAGLGGSLGSERSLAAALHSPQLLLPLAGLAILSLIPLLVRRLGRRQRPSATP